MATAQTTIHDPSTGTAQIKVTGLTPKIPTNITDKQIDSTLSEAEKKLQAQKSRLDSQGKAIVDDAQDLIEITRKNELFQKLFTFAQKAQAKHEGGPLQQAAETGVPSADLMSAGKTLMNRATGMASALQTDAEDVAGYIRDSLYNFLTSAEYREIAADFYSILRSLAAELEGEFKELEDDARKPNKSKSSDTAWNKSVRWDCPKPSDKVDAVKQVDQQGAQKAFQQGQQGSTQAFLQGQQDTSSGQQQKSEQSGQDLRQPQKAGQQKSEKWQNKMKELEDEEVEDILNQINSFLQRIADKKDYQRLVNNFFKFSDQLNDTLIDVTEQAKQSPEAREVHQLLDQSFEILSDFAGKNNVQKYRKDLTTLFNKIKEDQDLKKWRKATRDYIEESLKNPGQFEKGDAEKAVEKLKELIQDGRKVLNKYTKEINAVYDDQIKIAQKIKNDPTLKEFERSLKSLGSHLALNDKGEVDPNVMQRSFSQITSLMAGLFHNYLVKLPVSKVEIYSQDYDIVLEDIKAQGSGFAPDMIDIKTDSHTKLWFIEKHENESALRINLSVSNICPAFKDFKYYFNHKTFPTYEDRGRASIETNADGLNISARIVIRTQPGNLPSRVSLSKLNVHLGTLKITTGPETQHSILAPLLAPMFAETVRMRIEKTIYNSLRSYFEDMVSQVNEFFEEDPLNKVADAFSQMASNIQANLPSADDLAQKADKSQTIRTH